MHLAFLSSLDLCLAAAVDGSLSSASLICTLILQAPLICWLWSVWHVQPWKETQTVENWCDNTAALVQGNFMFLANLPSACKAVCLKILRSAKPLNASVTPIYFVLDFQWVWADVSPLVSVEALCVFREKFRAALLPELCDDLVLLNLLMMINLFACISVSYGLSLGSEAPVDNVGAQMSEPCVVRHISAPALSPQCRICLI